MRGTTALWSASPGLGDVLVWGGGVFGRSGGRAGQAGFGKFSFQFEISTTLGLAAPAGMTRGGFETAASCCQNACATTALWHT